MKNEKVNQIDFEGKPVVVELYRSHKTKDGVEIDVLEELACLSHVFEDDKVEKLKTFSIKDVVEYVFEHAEVNNYNDEVYTDIQVLISNKPDYTINSYNKSFTLEREKNTNVIIEDHRLNSINDETLWDLKKDKSKNEFYICELRVTEPDPESGSYKIAVRPEKIDDGLVKKLI